MSKSKGWKLQVHGCYIDVFCGALTSKTYSFTKRTWEVKSIKIVNFFDIFLTELVFETQNNNILRILPIGLKKRVLDSAYSSFLLDKVRFAVDGFKRHRIHNRMYPLLYDAHWMLKRRPRPAPARWRPGINNKSKMQFHYGIMDLVMIRNINYVLKCHYRNNSPNHGLSQENRNSTSSSHALRSRVGAYRAWFSGASTGSIKPYWLGLEAVTVEVNETWLYRELMGLKSLLYKHGLIKGQVSLPNLLSNSCSFIAEVGLDMASLATKEHLIFVGLEIRFDVPLLNLFIRKKQHQLRIFNFGTESFMNYKVYNLGNSVYELIKLLSNKQYISILGFNARVSQILLNGVYADVVTEYAKAHRGRPLFDISIIRLQSSFVTTTFMNLHVGPKKWSKIRKPWTRPIRLAYQFKFNLEDSLNADCAMEVAKVNRKANRDLQIFFGIAPNFPTQLWAIWKFDCFIYQPSVFYRQKRDFLFNVEGKLKLIFEGLGDTQIKHFFKLNKSFFAGQGGLRRAGVGLRALKGMYSYYQDVELGLAITNKPASGLRSSAVSYIAKVNPNMYIDEIYCTNEIALASSDLETARESFISNNSTYQLIVK